MSYDLLFKPRRWGGYRLLSMPRFITMLMIMMRMMRMMMMITMMKAVVKTEVDMHENYDVISCNKYHLIII